MSRPVPMLVESAGRFFARWSCDDDTMRTKNRSVFETPDSIDSADDAFLVALRSDDDEVHWDSLEDLKDLRRRLEAWRLDSSCDAASNAEVAFRLHPPTDADGRWRLDLATEPKSADALRALGRACRAWPPLCGMSDRSLDLEQSEMEAFLRVGASSLMAAGYRVDLPENLAAEVSAEAVISPEDEASERVAGSASLLANITIRVAGEKVTREEIEFLLEQESSVVFFRGRWIEVDRGILKSALKVLESADGRKMTEREAMAFAFGFRRARGLSSSRVKGTGWFGKILEELRSGGRFRQLRKPKGFKGSLRDYQLRGYSWIKFLTDRGFGALLADDMGLGKTVQVIAWMLKRMEGGACRTLVVAPVSVTMNWVREIGRFAPKLKVILHQGKERLSGSLLRTAASRCDVVVTGYPLFTKDFKDLSDIRFDALVLDEAQTIKNPDTNAARAARSFPCVDRIALTGTPFENHVTDLWSIEEFLNAGMLGTRSEFVNDFDRPLREGGGSSALAELKKTLEPFLLRRMKNDPGIAAELGTKREVREYCVLTPRQRAAYEVALAHYANGRRGGQGGKGAALALLTELKLVCDGLSGDGALHGGKVERIEQLLESIFDAGESALVFTQYVKVGERLKALIEKKFGRRVPFLHGGLQPSAREAQIAAFNSSAQPTAFVLSLKAGGFGLNLTKATHVIHYDRWWNPAVENQATDRAHRIGQTRPVLVHLFMAHGTLEDRIDSLLEEKRALAGELVVSGESFLLKMGDAEFARTVRLS